MKSPEWENATVCWILENRHRNRISQTRIFGPSCPDLSPDPRVEENISLEHTACTQVLQTWKRMMALALPKSLGLEKDSGRLRFNKGKYPCSWYFKILVFCLLLQSAIGMTCPAGTTALDGQYTSQFDVSLLTNSIFIRNVLEGSLGSLYLSVNSHVNDRTVFIKKHANDSVGRQFQLS